MHITAVEMKYIGWPPIVKNQPDYQQEKRSLNNFSPEAFLLLLIIIGAATHQRQSHSCEHYENCTGIPVEEPEELTQQAAIIRGAKNNVEVDDIHSEYGIGSCQVEADCSLGHNKCLV
jgi:hypothetical protein